MFRHVTRLIMLKLDGNRRPGRVKQLTTDRGDRSKSNLAILPVLRHQLVYISIHNGAGVGPLQRKGSPICPN